MDEISIDDLIELVGQYDLDSLSVIRKAYDYADYLHMGQVRQSGEAYISHPLNVAYILGCMQADRDTICAALLHDTLEQTDTSKEEIARLFNKTIANLVDGVTKMERSEFSTKLAQNLANTRKIIVSMIDDVRIVIIKLADRLHNMRTLQYKNELKQKENALETLKLYVPLADRIGLSELKGELADLALKYLEPDIYCNIEERRNNLSNFWGENDMSARIEREIDDSGIFNVICSRMLGIYEIYELIKNKDKLCNQDLLYLKIVVDNVDDCYQMLDFVHSLYNSINDEDYIVRPLSNQYQSLHTTLLGDTDSSLQMRIRTFDMDKIACYGLAAYWNKIGNDAYLFMQNDFRKKYQFFDSLLEINKCYFDDKEFIEHVNCELLAENISVFGFDGEIIELPVGATVVDLAYKMGQDIGNKMVKVIVNGKMVPFDYVLVANDKVKVITNNLSCGPDNNWVNIAKTTYAKRKIREFNH